MNETFAIMTLRLLMPHYLIFKFKFKKEIHAPITLM